LKETLKEVIPAKRELLKKVKAIGSKVIGEVKIENTIGGMRYAKVHRNGSALGSELTTSQRAESNGMGRLST
jgi:hypothetical protein